jgi:hypothetical protein
MTKTETRALRCLFKRLGGIDGKMSFSNMKPDVERIVQEETKLWRDSWILPALGALVAVGEGRATSDDKQAIADAAKEGW